jgi:hypothetical protein
MSLFFKTLFLFITVLLILDPFLLLSQNTTEAIATEPNQMECFQKDIGEVLLKGVRKDKPPRKTMLLALPNVSYNPVNGLLMGLVGSAGFYLGDKETTRVSSLGFNMSYTTKNQFLFFTKSNIYSKDNGFFLQGDWRFFYTMPIHGDLEQMPRILFPAPTNFFGGGANRKY